MKLEWKVVEPYLFEADGGFMEHKYRVVAWSYDDEWEAGIVADTSTSALKTFGVWHATSNEAKAACQADYDARVAAIALANGYVKAEDYEALKAKVAELTDLLEDATDTLDLIESEADLFDATAIASGYVKLEPGQVVVTVHGAACAIDVFCHDCRLDKPCESCVVGMIRDRIKEARDARV